MAQKWYVLNEDFEPCAGPYTVEQLRSLLNDGKVEADTDIMSTDGIGMDVGSLVLHGYSYLSHRQRAYLVFLGYRGSMYISQDDCSYAIQRLKTINPNGVDNLDFDKLVEEEERRGDSFFLEAERYIQRNGYDALPLELQRPKEQTAASSVRKAIQADAPRKLTRAEKVGCAALLLFAISSMLFGLWKTISTLLTLLVVLCCIVACVVIFKQNEKQIKKFVSNNVPFVVIGITITVVLLVILWLVFWVF